MHQSTLAIRVPAGDLQLEGGLTVPDAAAGLILFAHGSGSSRHSPRNRQVATALNRAGFATLLLDLLSVGEDRDPVARFDIPLLAERLEAALDWVLAEPALKSTPIGLFGASTGAAAALILAATRPDEVGAVVSRGGRPDLAGDEVLSQVLAPTLLIVGDADTQVLALNQGALALMPPGKSELVTIPGATHLFEERGALEQVAKLAADWFARHLTARDARAAKAS
jgi:pimeloyl-ACP methyl ester carboxylesterase